MDKETVEGVRENIIFDIEKGNPPSPIFLIFLFFNLMDYVNLELNILDWFHIQSVD